MIPPRSADQIRQNATQYLRAGNIVIGHANFPAVTQVYDAIIALIQTRQLQTVTLTDVFTTQPRAVLVLTGRLRHLIPGKKPVRRSS